MLFSGEAFWDRNCDFGAQVINIGLVFNGKWIFLILHDPIWPPHSKIRTRIIGRTVEKLCWKCRVLRRCTFLSGVTLSLWGSPANHCKTLSGEWEVLACRPELKQEFGVIYVTRYLFWNSTVIYGCIDLVIFFCVNLSSCAISNTNNGN